MKTYYEVGGKTFDSKEEAVRAVAAWKTVPHNSILTITNFKVTRKTAKGAVIVEQIRGREALARAPRVISIEELEPTYAVVTDGVPAGLQYKTPSVPLFDTLAKAEEAMAEQRQRANLLASLQESDIREVHIPTLADILERDANAIDVAETAMQRTEEEVQVKNKEVATEAQRRTQSLREQVDALNAQISLIQLQVADEFGLTLAQQQAKATCDAYERAIHYDEFYESVTERLHEEHRCWAEDDCRGGHECDYEPDWDEIVEYLTENAEEFEIGRGAKRMKSRQFAPVQEPTETGAVETVFLPSITLKNPKSGQ